MNTKTWANSTTSMNGWLIGGLTVFLAAIVFVLLTPSAVGQVMGTGGDGIGQFFVALTLGGAGLLVVIVSMVVLLMLSLLAWLS